MIADINGEDRLVQKTFADVKVLVLDSLWQNLPRPPFTEQETQQLADRVYDYVWQRGASVGFPTVETRL